MAGDHSGFRFTDETKFEHTDHTLTDEEVRWLESNGVMDLKSYRHEEGDLLEVEMDVEKLAEIAYEFDLLKETGSAVETEILDTFRQSTRDTLTTKEITDAINRPKSSVSRALTRLTDGDKVTKVQPGVYRYP